MTFTNKKGGLYQNEGDLVSYNLDGLSCSSRAEQEAVCIRKKPTPVDHNWSFGSKCPSLMVPNLRKQQQQKHGLLVHDYATPQEK